MPYVEKDITIKANPADAYKLACNMEGFPDFMPDVQSVKVIKREDNMTVTDWITEIDGTEIIWTEEDHFFEAEKKITYKLIEGDLDKFEGEWRFEEVPEGTKITLTVDFDFGIPELVHLIGDLLTIKVGENSEMMLNGFKSRLEGQD
ncbi:MAG: aromatase/cyclase [bacterium]|nr:aromatase/cyclase [bacterium]